MTLRLPDEQQPQALRTSPLKPAESAAQSSEPLSGTAPQVGSTVKHYELLRKLGEGGMGTVYLARDTTLGRLVAIKVLQLQSALSTERFLVEAQATARCRHDNIVVIHEVDQLHGYLYMVLEYLEGRTLREWLTLREHGVGATATVATGATSGPVPPAVAVELFLPVVRALACAHQLGIVHRDLKPENIFLTGTGRVVVLDFGIAKWLDPQHLSALDPVARPLEHSARLTQDGALLGTLPYMSPEQLRSEDVDARSDLWAVGMLLYELVAGAHPLAHCSVHELVDLGDSAESVPSIRDRRPDVGALGAIIDRCLRKPREQRYGSAEELLAALEAFALDRQHSELGEDESPFPGLSAFQEADAERYVGRDREIVRLTRRLRNEPVVVVAGPSGAGKSSFVRAGVIPALKRSGERWKAFILRPGRRPLAQLANLLAQLEPIDPVTASSSHERAAEVAVAALHAQPGLVGAQLRALCGRAQGPHRILVYVDQFEELYTMGADPAERAAFVACLEGVADDASSPLRVMISLRSEYLYRMAEEDHFLSETARGLVFLRPMQREGLREALLRPVEAAGYRYDSEAMVDTILDGLAHAKSPLPLLQFTAQRLWEARDRTTRCLTEASYHQGGGVAGALSAHANAVLASLSLSDQRLCRAVFLQLCTPERTRAAMSLADLRAGAVDGNAVEQVVRRLSDARLVVIEAGTEREGATVELTHESLIESWDKLQQWLAESEHDAQFIARLSTAARQWEASHAAEGLLWRDRAARDAADWLARRRIQQGAGQPLGLGTRDEQFLLAVVALSERTHRRRRRIQAGVLGTAGLIATLMFVLSISAKRKAAEAQLEARQARNATRMATARELEQKDPTTMLALLREVEPPGVPRGWAELASKALQSVLSREVRFWGTDVHSAAWSPDGQRVIAALEDGTARIWQPGDPAAPVALRGHQTSIASAAFSPDGTRIVTASEDKTIRVWKTDSSEPPIVLRGHELALWGASFSPDGTRIASASTDRTARVWLADGTGTPIVLRGHEDRVVSAAFSPDGQRVVTASYDNTARVWDADGSGRFIVLRGHDGPVGYAAFSPDGSRIVTGSSDNTVRIWNADGSGDPLVLRGHTGPVRTAVFSPDGSRILSASTDWTARVWTLDGSTEPLVLRGHENFVFTAAWSPDGSSVVTASLDQTSRVFRVAPLSVRTPTLLRGHDLSVVTAAFSDDHQYVVTGSTDHTARVWRADGSGEPIVLRGHEGAVRAVAFSVDNQRVVTASDDRTARVWRADGTGAPVVLRGHTGPIRRVAFSRDGERIITTSADDKTVRIWRADGTGEPLVLHGHEEAAFWAGFSPDGMQVATASEDRAVRVFPSNATGELRVQGDASRDVRVLAWSPDSQRLLVEDQDTTARVRPVDGAALPWALRASERGLASAAWSPDGKLIATGWEDATARVWSVDRAEEVAVLRGHARKVRAVTFSPDGHRIITTSVDATVRVWNADGSGEPYVLSLGAGQSMSYATLSPSGNAIATTYPEKVVRILPLLEPFTGSADTRLWNATPYCLSVERRIALLSISEARARADQAACERRVKASASPSLQRAAAGPVSHLRQARLRGRMPSPTMSADRP